MILDDLADDFPNVIEEFRQFFIARYRYNPDETFNNAPLKQQVIILRRFLGYPCKIPKGMKKKDAEVEVLEFLKEYQRLIIKDSLEGIPDIIQEMLHLDEEERLKLIPNLHDRQIYPSLRDSLVVLGEKGAYIMSIRDALVQRTDITQDEIDSSFWDNLKIEENVPF